MAEVAVGRADSFKARDRKVVVVEGIEIGVFRLGDDFFAWENRCVHMGGPVCQGKIINRVEERLAPDKQSLGYRFSPTEVNIVCPWHGYEYDIRTGCHQGNPLVRLKAVELKLKDGTVFVVV
ncbi:MAG: Rieske 2Fe-2S domain-containing protein [Candidatus Parcubacteria bacterium]|nr:Rieske 2Fe-2S domain-containing protein [Burkholderiales bacterium]